MKEAQSINLRRIDAANLKTALLLSITKRHQKTWISCQSLDSSLSRFFFKIMTYDTSLYFNEYNVFVNFLPRALRSDKYV